MRKPLIKVLYNPVAGSKRVFTVTRQYNSIEDIQALLSRYQIDADYVPTKGPGHATELARNSVKEGYRMVLAAGGDGTVGEVANGLVNTDVTMGILPLGTFMNTARMLAIPDDLEKAVLLIKVGRTRKIDLGCVRKLNGEKLAKPYYFIEGAGVGLDAEFHKYFREVTEQGRMGSMIHMLQLLLSAHGTLLTVLNGPFTGAGLALAPKAKLNDHRLSVRMFDMTKFELLYYFLRMRCTGKVNSHKIKTHQVKKIVINPIKKQPVHIDATLFGTTPAEFRIIPNALSVVYGFPEDRKSAALRKRNVLVP
jgi:diacylglycerol kinase (ATP)